MYLSKLNDVLFNHLRITFFSFLSVTRYNSAALWWLFIFSALITEDDE